MRISFVLTCAALLCALDVGASDWNQWGGPHRDFKSDTTGLASKWPAEGPKRLWQRPLGEGYSAISVDDGRLFTMYRKGEQEVAIALDAKTGATIWETAWDAPFLKGQDFTNGPGPHSAPLVSNGRVFVTGVTAKFHALDEKTGKILWSHDLMTEYQATLRVNGYACSPIAYGGNILVTAGGPGHALMAFHETDGKVAWASGDFKNSPSSPALIQLNGEDQIVAAFWDDIAGFDAKTGALRWSIPNRVEFGLNVSTPVFGPDNILFFSAAYNGSGRGVQLTKAGDSYTAEDLFRTSKLRIHFTNAVRVGDIVYGSNGDSGGGVLTAFNVKTGKLAFQDRNIARSGILYADGKFILLDEDGNLMLATGSETGMNVISKAQVAVSLARTPPTLSGTTLFVRDRKTIQALDLR
ncbi:MAG: PQQ-binding-like beta-propeller repeat protein [Bryobacteraceae bacterium]